MQEVTSDIYFCFCKSNSQQFFKEQFFLILEITLSDLIFVENNNALSSAANKLCQRAINSNIRSIYSLVPICQAEAYIKLRIQVNNLTHPENSFNKAYEAKVTSSTMSMHDTVSAFGRALDEISKMLASDLAGV